MTLLYIWLVIVGLLFMMLISKLIIKCVLLCKGLSTDWASYNSTMLVLACIAFIPIALLWTLVKNAK